MSGGELLLCLLLGLGGLLAGLAGLALAPLSAERRRAVLIAWPLLVVGWAEARREAAVDALASEPER